MPKGIVVGVFVLLFFWYKYNQKQRRLLVEAEAKRSMVQETKKIDENLINDFNAELLMRLHETGEHAPSSALLNGIFSIRVAITNHRSRLNDFNKLVDDVVIIGNDMLKNYI